MKNWSLLLIFLFLFLPATAGGPVADINIKAYEYFDDCSQEWQLVESVRIEQLNGRYDCVSQDCGGVENTELALNGLAVDSLYRVEVKWVNGASYDETYTVYESGSVNLWVDTPEYYY